MHTKRFNRFLKIWVQSRVGVIPSKLPKDRNLVTYQTRDKAGELGRTKGISTIRNLFSYYTF